MLRLASRREPAIWSAFERASAQLDRWIDEQNPRLNTPAERALLQKINTLYDEYLASARQASNESAGCHDDRGAVQQKAWGALQYQTQANHGTAFGIVLPEESRSPA